MEINIDNKSVSSNDSHSKTHSDQLPLVSKKLHISTSNNSIFNQFSNLEESCHISINNGYAESNDNPHAYPNVINNSMKKVHSNLEENTIASDQSPKPFSNQENSNVT